MDFIINEVEIIKLVERAGEAIIRIYNMDEKSQQVELKDDDSPLTLADRASHEIIDAGLQLLHPDIPIISEEGESLDYNVRKEYKTFWLVDPLDATKEFINKNGQFTVNVALIVGNESVAGFVYAPVLKTHYIGIKRKGAYTIENGQRKDIRVNNKSTERTAVRSKSHASKEEEAVLERYNVTDSISVGSSLKFCMVACGKADIYYRHGPTMEWDTAAGQAVVEAAGGVVYKNTSNERFLYNKRELLNSSFLCLGF